MCVYACSYISTRVYTRGALRMHAAVARRCTARAASRVLSRSHARTHARTHMSALGRDGGRRDTANAFAERARLHWRHSQPIGLSSDEFTPPDRRAELLRGGQFALRISALAFFSSSCSLSLFSSSSRPSVSLHAHPSVRSFAFASSPSPPFPASVWLLKQLLSRPEIERIER